MTFRLTCMAGELARALQLAAQTAGREKQIPILRAVMIAVTKSGATISATNNDHGVTVSIAAEGEGTAYVDIGLILPKAQVMRPGQPVTLSSEDGKFIEMKQGRTGLKAPMLDGDAFPVDMTKAVDGEAIIAAASPLLHALSVAPDAILPSLAGTADMGALLDMGDGKFRVISTNRKIMSVIELDIPALQISEIVLPNAAMAAICSMFRDAGELQIVATKDAMSVSTDQLVYRTRLIEGRYPPWRMVVKGLDALDRKGTVATSLALETVTRATAISEDRKKDETVLDAHVSIIGGEMQIRAKNRSSEAGEDACEFAGDDGEFVVSAAFLRKMLGNIGTQSAALEYSEKYDQDMPVVIRAHPSEMENYRVIMQMRVAK